MICFFIILLVCLQNDGAAQSNYISDTSKTPAISFRGKVFSLHNSAQPQQLEMQLNIIPVDHYLRMIGLFCKKEIQLEKAVKMPVRFRLGSVAYTDRMENKNTFIPADPFRK